MEINFVAVFVAALAMFVVGFLMHGPVAGKLWMRLSNIVPTGNEKFSDMVPQMLWNFVANLVTATVFAGAMWVVFSSPVMGAETWYKGAICAAWAWLGLLVTSSSMEVIWLKRSYKLWLFECFCSLLSLAVMGAIITGW
ncbi:MAG: hypothetical protein RLZZ26_16 [Candidatus Parcubacteria bacterium]|jgi:hypothetical protein